MKGPKHPTIEMRRMCLKDMKGSKHHTIEMRRMCLTPMKNRIEINVIIVESLQTFIGLSLEASNTLINVEVRRIPKWNYQRKDWLERLRKGGWLTRYVRSNTSGRSPIYEQAFGTVLRWDWWVDKWSSKVKCITAERLCLGELMGDEPVPPENENISGKE
jgi:hypothetical protein